jgi:hypothetical protein
LKYIVHRDAPRVLGPDLFAKNRFEVLADNENDAIKPRTHRVEHGIVEDRLTRRSDGIDLLQPAVAGAHAGGENKEREVHQG